MPQRVAITLVQTRSGHPACFAQCIRDPGPQYLRNALYLAQSSHNPLTLTMQRLWGAL